MSSIAARRPVRVISVSGAVTDLPENLAEAASHANVDFIVGDWMSEYNMTIRGSSKIANMDNVQAEAAFEHTFLEALEPALASLATRDIKLAVNAGSSDTFRLCQSVENLVKEKDLSLTVAWVEGDEVFEIIQRHRQQGKKFRNITTGQYLDDWKYEPIYAQCYLGSWGITESFRNGADIVICGRVADAAPTMAAAAFWHGWTNSSYEELAHSLIAGHLIECSTYVTGGNFTGFKSLPQGSNPLLNLPIATIRTDGTFSIGMHESLARGGQVSFDTCRSQLLYELQGKRYYNSDVVAIVDQIKMEPDGPNSVFVNNIKWEKPPPTSKVGLTAKGGFQAEVHYFAVGLDILEKSSLLEKQLRSYLDCGQFSLLKITTSGCAQPNPASQDEATVDIRIFAQADAEDTFTPKNFLRPCWNIIMSTYPGATFAIDNRQGLPKPYFEYFVTIFPQSEINHVAHIPSRNWSKPIAAPEDTVPYQFEQDVQDGPTEVDVLRDFGPTTTTPLGYVVHARSGDKGSDCNVGFYARNRDEWLWLRSLLTVQRVKDLLQNDYNGKRIERFELPNIQAVHFLLKDHLDRGVSSTSTYDALGKNVAEYLRAKHVPIPNQFLARGKI
ncbi:hypothetical protein N7510_008780 [Penicillium lagena]|uniref:uncharacterized protein n=1 Tax=Penicillium lagena TaxID=94218 RepID=UPI0025409172|nr:uncharacterized protein N7510_008780 [Penicillium lagena]KAJ5605999.1 hypothetical protein N7510_008780 [Penicillium lagena]